MEYPKSPGHFEEWVGAIQGGEPAMSNFPDYAGRWPSWCCLGIWPSGAASKDRMGRREDAVKNVAGLEPLIKPTYRSGYTLDA